MACSFPGCEAKVLGRGLCSGHYHQRRRGEELRPIIRSQSTAARFWAKVKKTETCWEWVGATSPHGYGNFFTEYGCKGAHRFAYELSVGPIPDGLVLDHLCRNTRCVNPAHLEPVTQQVNTQRGLAGYMSRERHAAQTHCKSGHPLSGSNLYIQPKTGYRYCRTCQKRRDAEYRARKAAA